MLTDTKLKRITTAIYVAGLAWLCYCSSFLFGRQIAQFNGHYPSDMHFYVDNAINGEGERCLTKIFVALYKLSGGSINAIVVYLGIVIVVICVASFLIMRELVDIWGVKVPDFYTQALSLIIVYSGNIYVPLVHRAHYRNSWASFAWHSPTQQTMDMFALLAMFCFIKLCRDYRTKIDSRWWIGVAIFGTFATWTKPSCFMVFAPALIIAFLFELKGLHGEELKERFTRLFIMGLSQIPSGLVMLYYMFWYGGNVTEENGSAIRFGLARFLHHYPSVRLFVVRVLSGLAIPIVVFLFNRYCLKELNYRITALMLGFGVAEWMFIYETGRNARFGNFGWGKQFACLYTFICTYPLIIKNWKDKEFLKEKPKLRAFYFGLIMVIFVGMMISQFCYFYRLLKGKNYMV